MHYTNTEFRYICVCPDNAKERTYILTGRRSISSICMISRTRSKFPATKERLRTHWDTFVTKEDFEKVSSAGVTHVRIPVGYW